MTTRDFRRFLAALKVRADSIEALKRICEPKIRSPKVRRVIWPRRLT